MQQDKPITLLLDEFAGGDKEAVDHLVPLLYPELRRLARGYLRNERSSHTLQATALVHEAYARLVKQDQPDYRSRAHFMGVAAQVMRQILIDHARIRNVASWWSFDRPAHAGRSGTISARKVEGRALFRCAERMAATVPFLRSVARAELEAIRGALKPSHI
jgi:DNA-directed RNA polymerase specialized sigma24 family protein